MGQHQHKLQKKTTKKSSSGGSRQAPEPAAQSTRPKTRKPQP